MDLWDTSPNGYPFLNPISNVVSFDHGKRDPKWVGEMFCNNFIEFKLYS